MQAPPACAIPAPPAGSAGDHPRAQPIIAALSDLRETTDDPVGPVVCQPPLANTFGPRTPARSTGLC